MIRAVTAGGTEFPVTRRLFGKLAALRNVSCAVVCVDIKTSLCLVLVEEVVEQVLLPEEANGFKKFTISGES